MTIAEALVVVVQVALQVATVVGAGVGVVVAVAVAGAFPNLSPSKQNLKFRDRGVLVKSLGTSPFLSCPFWETILLKTNKRWGVLKTGAKLFLVFRLFSTHSQAEYCTCDQCPLESKVNKKPSRARSRQFHFEPSEKIC